MNVLFPQEAELRSVVKCCNDSMYNSVKILREAYGVKRGSGKTEKGRRGVA